MLVDQDLIKATVLGAGTMGTQIALSLSLGGLEVQLWSRSNASLESAETRLKDAFDFLVTSDLAAPENKAETLDRISLKSNFQEAVVGSDFVIEAVAEDLKVKQDILKSVEEIASKEVVLSSTTSAIGAFDIQSSLKHPERFCIAHYAQPAHLVKLVEVVPGKLTAQKAAAFTENLLKTTGKVPVRCPDIPGFLWARIQHAVLREFACLVGQGLVTPEACDTILKQGYAARLPAMGAFEHADLAGLDLMNGDAAKAVWADLNNVKDPAETPVGQLFRDGKLGMSNGEGFYEWSERDSEEFKRQRDKEIVRRVKIQAGEEAT